MTTAGTFTQWSTIAPWLGTLPGWVPVADQQRIASYSKYEEIYWSSEEGFEEVMRGDNENPVFMPTARTLVNTVNRYTAPKFSWRIEPLNAEAPDENLMAVARLAFQQLFAREGFLGKFNSNKFKGIIRGDWLWHIIADDTKPVGRRIKIMVVHPSAYFPVYESDILEGGDPDKIVRVHLAETIRIQNQERVSRLTYNRIFDAEGNQTGISVSHGIFAMQDWVSSQVPERVVIPETVLPPEIPAIPIYHLKNFDPTEPFGSSEMRGLESVLLGINQTVSDEDMTLAIEGLGIYATDGGAPVDEAGNETEWIWGPGRVLTNSNNLRRISGTSSVTPFGDHYNRLVEAVRQAVGASDVAVGRVESATAESGIALLLQLGPILAYTGERDQHIVDVHAQMFHDLCFWLTAYEELPLLVSGGDEGGQQVPGVLITPTIGEKIPRNIKQIIETVIQLRSTIPPLISLTTAHTMLKEANVPIADDEAGLIATEQAELMANLNGETNDQEDSDRTDTELADEEALV